MGAAVPGEEAELAVGGVAGGGAGAGGGKQGGIVTSPPAPGRYEAYGVCSGERLPLLSIDQLSVSVCTWGCARKPGRAWLRVERGGAASQGSITPASPGTALSPPSW